MAANQVIEANVEGKEKDSPLAMIACSLRTHTHVPSDGRPGSLRPIAHAIYVM